MTTVQNTRKKISKQEARASLDVYRAPVREPMRDEDAKTICALIDGLTSYKYYCDRRASGDAVNLIFRLCRKIYEEPDVYLPVISAGLEQARFNAEQEAST